MEELLIYLLNKCAYLDGAWEGGSPESCTKVPAKFLPSLQALDSKEEHFHFEMEEDKQVVVVWRINHWRQATLRRQQLEEQSKKNKEESIKWRQDQEERLVATNKAIELLRRSGKAEKDINTLLELCWNGELPTIAEKLGLSRWCSTAPVKVQTKITTTITASSVSKNVFDD